MANSVCAQCARALNVPSYANAAIISKCVCVCVCVQVVPAYERTDCALAARRLSVRVALRVHVLLVGAHATGAFGARDAAARAAPLRGASGRERRAVRRRHTRAPGLQPERLLCLRTRLLLLLLLLPICLPVHPVGLLHVGRCLRRAPAHGRLPGALR